MTDVFLLLAGLAALLLGGELLVRGAVGLALKLNISKLVIGMTIVSFGTSAPELLISLNSAFKEHPDIALGNVLGSNIANITLILGITALIFPLLIDRNTKRTDYPFMLAVTALCWLLMADQRISFAEGITMFSLLVVFTGYLIYKSRKEGTATENNNTYPVAPFGLSVLFLAISIFALAYGADWLLEGAVGLARTAGMSEKTISLTIVAFGTSVPELLTSAMAAWKKQGDISIGNLIGSNIFNILCILGLTAAVKEIPVADSYYKSDMIGVMGVAIMLGLVLYTGPKINRSKASILILFYLFYTIYLLLRLG
jgi:cation:H+ antiporter